LYYDESELQDIYKRQEGIWVKMVIIQ